MSHPDTTAGKLSEGLLVKICMPHSHVPANSTPDLWRNHTMSVYVQCIDIGWMMPMHVYKKPCNLLHGTGLYKGPTGASTLALD